MASGFWIIQTYLQNPLLETSTFYLFNSSSLILPLALSVLIIMPERGLWNIHGLLPLSITPIFCVFNYLLFVNLNEVELQTIETWFRLRPYAGYILSINTSVWFLASLVVALTVLFLRKTQKFLIRKGWMAW